MLGLKGVITDLKLYSTFKCTSNIDKCMVCTYIEQSTSCEKLRPQYDCIVSETALEIRKIKNMLKKVQGLPPLEPIEHVDTTNK